MSRDYFVLFLAVILVCFGACMQAQQAPVAQALPAQTSGDPVPHLIRFSGTLKDVSGKPRSGVVGVTFALYKDQEGGAPLWLETQNVQADSAGHYAVSLGTTQASGLPADVFASGDARWLGVQSEGQAEQPRVILLSVPYALKAADAETLGGKPLSAFQLAAPQSSASSAQQSAAPQFSTGSAQQSAALTDQANEITCANGTGCKAAFVPLFNSNGGSAKVTDSIITQSGTTIGIAGSESVRGKVSATGSVSGATAAFSSNTASPVLNVTQTGAGSGVAATITGTNDGPGVLGATSVEGVGVKGVVGTGSITGQGLGPPFAGVWGDSAPNGTAVLGTVDEGTALSGFNNGFSTTLFGKNLSASPNSLLLELQAPKVGNGSFFSVGADGSLFLVPGTQPQFTGLLAGDPGCGSGFTGFALGNPSFNDLGPCTTYSLIGDSSGSTYINSSLSRGGVIHLRHDNGTSGIQEVLVGDPGCGSGFGGIGIAALSGCQFYTLVGDQLGGTYLNAWNFGSLHFRLNNTTSPEAMVIGPDGTVSIAGNLNVGGSVSKGGGSFKIDHPLDPQNKYLSHSFVESPDMMNIYNGNVTTNKRGWATVVLPDYFDALNRDFRYQLTVVGQFAQAIVFRKISNHRFVIKTDKPNVEVSWQVTGIRQDSYANANRIRVEEDKPAKERGRYLHPELFGASPDLAVDHREPRPSTTTVPIPVASTVLAPMRDPDVAK